MLSGSLRPISVFLQGLPPPRIRAAKCPPFGRTHPSVICKKKISVQVQYVSDSCVCVFVRFCVRYCKEISTYNAFLLLHLDIYFVLLLCFLDFFPFDLLLRFLRIERFFLLFFLVRRLPAVRVGT